jgi:hypothetical protein
LKEVAYLSRSSSEILLSYLSARHFLCRPTFSELLNSESLTVKSLERFDEKAEIGTVFAETGGISTCWDGGRDCNILPRL